MATDPIVDEIHAIREEIARRHGYDLDAIVEAFQKASAQSDRRVVTLPPRPVVKPEPPPPPLPPLQLKLSQASPPTTWSREEIYGDDGR